MKAFQPSITFISLTSILFRLTSASFSLDISGPDWDYTAKDLAPTTSQACREAYSAPIDCDATLLGLVASMRPLFKPTASDFANTCTTTCQASLKAYVSNVQAACSADGDKAQEDLGGDTAMNLVPVEVVGQLFQYSYAQSCWKDNSGNYCSLQRLNYDVPCTDVCTIGFFQIAHDHPVSAYNFNYYWLVSRGSWWANQFQVGWARVKRCGKAIEKPGSTPVAQPSSATSTSSIIEVTAQTIVAAQVSPLSITSSSIDIVTVSSSISSAASAVTSIVTSAASQDSSTSQSSAITPTASATPIPNTSGGETMQSLDRYATLYISLMLAAMFI